MPATYFETITDDLIRDTLRRVDGATVEWTGRMPRDSEQWTDFAITRLGFVTVHDVRETLLHDISGDDPAGEVAMAISIAAEPDGLPDNAAVSVFYREQLTPPVVRQGATA